MSLELLPLEAKEEIAINFVHVVVVRNTRSVVVSNVVVI